MNFYDFQISGISKNSLWQPNDDRIFVYIFYDILLSGTSQQQNKIWWFRIFFFHAALPYIPNARSFKNGSFNNDSRKRFKLPIAVKIKYLHWMFSWQGTVPQELSRIRNQSAGIEVAFLKKEKQSQETHQRKTPPSLRKTLQSTDSWYIGAWNLQYYLETPCIW